MLAVGRAASSMIEEVRQQFKKYKLLHPDPSQRGQADYAACVEISTRASLIEMITPGILAICSPLVVGFILGREALGGMLIGALVSGFMLAIFMANAGGAWDNAKKWVEADGMGVEHGKGSKVHHATVVGDTIGDPFKDTSGPALNILIKLMTTMSIIFASVYPQGPFDEDWWWVGLIIFVIFFVVVGSLWAWMRHSEFGKINFDIVNEIEAEKGVEMESLIPSKVQNGHDGGQVTQNSKDAEIDSLRAELKEARATIDKLENKQSG